MVWRLEGSLLGSAKEKVCECRAGSRDTRGAGGAGSIYCCAARLGSREAGKDKGAGCVSGAENIQLYALDIAAESYVMLTVRPGTRFGQAHRLVGLKRRLLFVEAGELRECDIGQTVTQRAGCLAVQNVQAVAGRNVGDICEIVGRLGFRSIVGSSERIVQPAHTQGVAELRGILMGLCLSAKQGKNIRTV